MKEINKTVVPSALPSLEEIREIEKRCEHERSKIIGSVLVAPFIALRDLLDYKGTIEVPSQRPVGVVAQ